MPAGEENAGLAGNCPRYVPLESWAALRGVPVREAYELLRSGRLPQAIQVLEDGAWRPLVPEALAAPAWSEPGVAREAPRYLPVARWAQAGGVKPDDADRAVRSGALAAVVYRDALFIERDASLQPGLFGPQAAPAGARPSSARASRPRRTAEVPAASVPEFPPASERLLIAPRGVRLPAPRLRLARKYWHLEVPWQGRLVLTPGDAVLLGQLLHGAASHRVEWRSDGTLSFEVPPERPGFLRVQGERSRRRPRPGSVLVSRPALLRDLLTLGLPARRQQVAPVPVLLQPRRSMLELIYAPRAAVHLPFRTAELVAVLLGALQRGSVTLIPPGSPMRVTVGHASRGGLYLEVERGEQLHRLKFSLPQASAFAMELLESVRRARGARHPVRARGSADSK